MFNQKLRLVLCVVVILLVVISAVSAKTRRHHAGQNRRSRFLTFNTFDGDVSVDLEFSIPFITIPVKKTMENTFGSHEFSLPSVNINMAALVIGGVVVTATAVFLPVLLKSYAHESPNPHYRRLLDNTQFGADPVFDFANQLMMDSRTFQGCALKVACWTARGPNNQDVLKILGQINSNQILSSMLNATAIEEAISAGHLGRNCSTYGPCSIRDDHIPALFNSLSTFGRRKSAPFEP